MNTQTSPPAKQPELSTPAPAPAAKQPKTPTLPPAKDPAPAAQPQKQQRRFAYFRKELLTNAFYVGAAPVAFEQLDGNRGVLKIDVDSAQGDKRMGEVLTALLLAVAQQRGGVVRITEAEYIEKKNQFPYNPSSPSATRSQDEKLRIAPRPGMQGKAFRPPPPKGISQPKGAPLAGTEAPPAPPAVDVIDGVPQGPNPVPDFVPRMGRAAEAAKEPSE